MEEPNQHWATAFGLAALAGLGAWAYWINVPPTWAVVAVFFTSAFMIFPARMKEWFQTLGDLAQKVKDSIPLGGS